jgi:RNA polymerase sigma-70 factor (ECF subfamily)
MPHDISAHGLPLSEEPPAAENEEHVMEEQPRARSSKPATFDAYYLDDFTSLMWFAFRLGTPSMPEAEDAAQDAMRTALRHWDEIEAPYAYTRAAVRREVHRANARSARRREAEARAARQEVRSVADVFDRDTTMVLAMLRSLPPVQREALALAMDGFEPSEIAAINGQHTATVRSNLRHARRRLVQLLGRRVVPAAGKEGNHGP